LNKKPYIRVADILLERSVNDSADYAEKNMQNALLFFDETKQSMWLYCLKQIKFHGLIAEFGVYNGKSINYISSLLPNNKIYGFDSFIGLKEDWVGWEWSKGDFSLGGVLPKVNQNVELVPGFFDESLPEWLQKNKGEFSFINIDCDTYESSKTVLSLLGPERIVPGTIIIFDEYFGYNNWRNHEHKAWKEFVEKNNINYEYIAINHLQVAILVK